MEIVNKLSCAEGKKVFVTKKFEFEACHHLIDYKGKCSNPHGHSYKLEVTVSGAVQDDGMVLDFSCLKRLVGDHVICLVDHKDLNVLFDFQTTAENMAIHFFYLISAELPFEIELESVRLWETSSCFVEYRGGSL